jgi:ABC-2 type transport system permease protein
MFNAELASMFIRRNFKLTLTVSIGAAAIAFTLTTLFPGASVEDAERIAATWPEMMKILFGDPVHAFTTVYGWLNLQVFHLVFWIVFGLLASILASEIVAKEVERRTLDLLLSCSVTRIELAVSRLAALAALIALAILPFLVACVAGVVVIGEPLELLRLSWVCTIGYLLCMGCGATTLLVSIVLPAQIPAILASWSAIGLLFFYEEILSKMVPGLDRLSFLSPFHYYDAGDVLIRGSFSIVNVAMLLFLFSSLATLSVLVFARRDTT